MTGDYDTRESVGAVRDTAGSESFEALIYHCIKKAKKEAVNNNNNSRSKRTVPHLPLYGVFACSSALLCPDASSSQTQQLQASQAPRHRPETCTPARKRRKNTLRKAPYLHLASILRWSPPPREDRKALLTSVNSTSTTYGSLL
ncbi:uncharacterized protein LOC143477771 isoform X1 [Brachyhypopomus gauderio]|uniref:uncharacterized protein LOC143477771 isoform X1 n=1 Tax=Brachyhypopomus gauderio TaxID=698409 RepID=UPI00404187D5